MYEGLETIEINSWIELDKSIDRLFENKDFQKVILDGYFKEKALGAVSCLSEPGFIERNQRGSLMEELVAISNLQYYFKMIRNFAASANQAKQEIEEEEL